MAGLHHDAPIVMLDGDAMTAEKKAASGGELPEAAVTAVRSRDTNGGGALKPDATNQPTLRTD
jgi:hypothetical protein